MVADRRCSRCGVVKPPTEFYPRSDRPGQYNAQCKTCDAERAARANAARRANPQWSARRAHVRRRQRLRADYGLTDAEIERLEAITTCEGCGRTAEEVGHAGPSGSRLHFDHDHVTGRVRGVLCKPCNSILGLADDDSPRLRALADYLERHAHPR